MEAKRDRSLISGMFVREPSVARAEQDKLEARIGRAKDDVRRAMALFNEHLAGLAQTIIQLQAELSRARQGSWVPAYTIQALEERLQTAEAAYAELERERERLVLEPLLRVEQTELQLQDARRRTDVALAASAAGDALDRLRDSLAEAVHVAEARGELNELPPAS